MCIILGMKYDKMDEMLERYRAGLREERNQKLARRLAVPRTTEEMLRIFNEAAWLKSRTDEFTAG